MQPRLTFATRLRDRDRGDSFTARGLTARTGMPSRKTTSKKHAAAAAPASVDTGAPVAEPHAVAPDVYVDFVFDRGLLHVVVVNGSDAAAWSVSVAFDPSFRGLGGTQDTSALPLFRVIEFLAPRRRIETFLDRSSDYFQRKEPRRITADVSWHDEHKRRFTRRIVHDLGIYEDLTYVVPHSTAGDIASPMNSSRSTTPVTGRGDHGSPAG